jgi:SAM-dependent methyltransferase
MTSALPKTSSRDGSMLWKFAKGLRRLPIHPQWLLGLRRPTAAIARLRGRVLDVGCANRWAERHCASNVDYIGLDFPLTGRDLYAARPDVFADAAALPIATARIDAIICFEVLEHLRNPNAALVEFSRVLGPQGTLLLSMPFLYPIHDAPFDFQRLTEHGLRRDLELAGFDVVTLRKTGHAVRAAGLLLSLAMVGGLYARRRWFDYARMPLAAIGVLCINLSAMLLAWLIPDWSALGSGYEVEAQRR